LTTVLSLGCIPDIGYINAGPGAHHPGLGEQAQVDATDGPGMTTGQLSYDPQGGGAPKRVTISIVIDW
jgi:hypothetical protein